MLELAVAILVLISILVFLKIRKKKLSASGEQQKPVVQQSKPSSPSSSGPVVLQTKEPAKDGSESVLPETKIEKPATSPKPDVKLATTVVQATSTTVTPPAPYNIYNNKNIPQDSTLRRHYLTHIQAMIEELNQPCPTDSSLKRHHQALITTQLELCLNDDMATKKLTQCYENYKKTLASPVQKSQNTVPPAPEAPVAYTPEAACTATTEKKTDSKVAKIPEDSALKRHYLSNLSAQIASKLPPRPTDSTLRRHYDAMLETEIKKHLGC